VIEVDELLLLRLGLLGLLLMFVVIVAVSMSGAVRIGAISRPRQERRRPLLQVLSPGESGLAPGTSFELAGLMTIGRDAGNSIVITDPSVSASHAEIRNVRGKWVVTDLRSTNGTLVGSRPVDGRGATLRPGDTVSIGAVVMRFQA
jgi:hypothetical protein